MIRRRCLHKIDWPNFNQDLAARLITTDAHSDDDMASDFIAGIHDVLDRHAPLVATRKKDRRPCPWLTPKLVHLVREHNRLHRLWMQDRGNEQRRAAHRAARATARKLNRSLRNSYFIRQCDTSNLRQLLAIMNNVTGRKTQWQTPEAPIETLSVFFGGIAKPAIACHHIHSK